MTKPTEQPQWRRSPYCSAGACIEVARVADRYLIRDSKNPDVQLTFSHAEWAAFTKGVGGGHFE
jgi:hypothetical protein